MYVQYIVFIQVFLHSGLNQLLVLEYQVLLAHFVHIISTILPLLIQPFRHSLLTKHMILLLQLLNLPHSQCFLLLFIHSLTFSLVIQSVKHILTVVLGMQPLCSTLTLFTCLSLIVSVSYLVVYIFTILLCNGQSFLSGSHSLIKCRLI